MKVAVLGLGDSAYSIDQSQYDIVIGINYAGTLFKTDYGIAMDPPKHFSVNYVNAMYEKHKFKGFISHIVDWKSRLQMDEFYKIDLIPERGKVDLSTDKIPWSNNSGFVAVCVAYKIFGANQVDLYGVDLIKHKHLGVHNILSDAINDFQKLMIELNKLGCAMNFCDDSPMKQLVAVVQ